MIMTRENILKFSDKQQLVKSYGNGDCTPQRQINRCAINISMSVGNDAIYYSNRSVLNVKWDQRVW